MKKLFIATVCCLLMVSHVVYATPITTIRDTARETLFTAETGEWNAMISSETEVKIISIEDEKVLASVGGQIGYISRNDLKYSKRYAIGWLPLMERPEKESNVIEYIHLNDEIVIEGQADSGYMKVKYDGKVGYCEAIWLCKEPLQQITEEKLQEIKDKGIKTEEKTIVGENGETYHWEHYIIE